MRSGGSARIGAGGLDQPFLLAGEREVFGGFGHRADDRLRSGGTGRPKVARGRAHVKTDCSWYTMIRVCDDRGSW